ncbi:hypothetical protein QBC43DRAFT_365928 [Cladorrhinum sp. PSN259]|nr:hypothetical protein QBC43DRAFT_365928 [Cladorrhinum sp. PSN259]
MPPSLDSELYQEDLRVFIQSWLSRIPRTNYSQRNTHKSQVSEPSEGSGRLSPSTQMLRLALEPDGIITRYFNPDDLRELPEQLATLVIALDIVYYMPGIIPYSHKDALTAEVKTNHSRAIPDFKFAAPNHLENLPHPPPSHSDIKALFSWACHCAHENKPESSWYTEVHFPTLQLAIHGSMRHNEQLMDVANVINHCGQTHLRTRPIAFGVVSKRSDYIAGGGDGGEARLQVGTWSAGMWKLLEVLVRRRFDQFGPTPEEAVRMATIGMDCEANPGNVAVPYAAAVDAVVASNLSRLPFLPAVVVRGHEWYYTFTTREGEKTVLWRELPFGETARLVDIYKVFAGLRVLAEYADWHKPLLIAE